MKQTIDLMSPRYKVIALYPDCDFTIGHIIEFEKRPDGIFCFVEAMWWEPKHFDEYPHLFKKLEWWEEREQSDMPYYISTIGKNWYGIVFMVSSKTGEFVIKEGVETTTGHLSNFLPATEAEYNNYLKSK